MRNILDFPLKHNYVSYLPKSGESTNLKITNSVFLHVYHYKPNIVIAESAAILKVNSIVVTAKLY